MSAVAVSARAAVAVVLLIAGGAKLADLSGFAATIRLLVPDRAGAATRTVLPGAAAALAAAELAVGTISLCWPSLRWVSLAALVLAAGFTVVATVGYVRHRGRPCHCFGALTRRGFSRRTLVGALALLAAAALACWPARAGGELSLGLSQHVLLLAACLLLALVARTAAMALRAGPAEAGIPTHARSTA